MRCLTRIVVPCALLLLPITAAAMGRGKPTPITCPADVVSAMEDPNPAVNGQGHARLSQAGIAVEVGEGAREAAEINAGFLMRVKQGAPPGYESGS